ncbi:alpha/beta-hydrolase [Lojkania enalia]|uniref:Alpha/beta-hydrolase n=1 Tax=Lojkania enalia TaxID=147567 RepID=A0A9P4TQD8_9PLEO|nr:alpha/beta-hydrolase [Didymosphaeria enalia]
MANVTNDAEELDPVQPYSMHVSSRYLELTKKKLQLTRLPRELELPEDRRWEHGTPKAVLEPLLDYWLEKYDWRTQEAHFNSSLPQFRTTVKISPTLGDPAVASHSLRIHFVHKRSKHNNAIPLVFCHTWPSSFIEVEKVIDALTDPQSLPSFGAGAQQAFHVVAPSIPGFGFSDASSTENFGLRETAAMFNGLMEKLGYHQYVAHGTGWGFRICRALALDHPENCLAVHTTNPTFEEPTLKHSPLAYMKYRVARLTRAKIPFLSFGYVPAEIVDGSQSEARALTRGFFHSLRPSRGTMSLFYSLRPQTLSFSLCDSPVGLLGALLDIIHTRAPSSSPITSRSRSPFLSPAELEMQDSHHDRRSHDDQIEPASSARPEAPFNPLQSEIEARHYTWSPTELLNWTMMQWLPGPEASLRWLRCAQLSMSPDSIPSTAYSPILLGISTFRSRHASHPPAPLMFGSTQWPIAWVKRHQRPATLPAWEAPDLLVLDMRECFGGLVAQGRLMLRKFPDSETEGGGR